MRAVRFGSYSIAATLAGTPNFSRRKSMRRYCRLWPPPRYRDVMWPLLLRPPVPRFGSSSDFSGVVFVISPKSDTERNRVAGVTGLNCRMPMSALEHLDRVALFEGDDRLLPRRAAPHVAAVALPLGPHHQRAHVGHGHVEQRLDGRADLRLGGLLLHSKRVFLAGLKRRRGLLGDDRPDDQMVPLRHLRSPPSRSRRPAPAARRPPHPPTGSRTRWRRRTASRAPSAGCDPTGRRCVRAPPPPSPPALSSPPRPAWRAAPPTSWSSASRTRARPPRTARPRAPGRSGPISSRAGASSWGCPGGSCAGAGRTRYAHAERGPGRCPSGATASGSRPRPRSACAYRASPDAGS